MKCFFYNNYKQIISTLVITIVLALISCIGTYINFYDGLPYGHDTYYHFSNIYDEYLNLLECNPSPISANLASGLGIGKQLFYSPLPHKTVALVGVLLKPFGVSLINAFKLVIFLIHFISGIFMYKLGTKLANGSKYIGIIAAAIFILNPYRLFDVYCRLAFAEVYSFLFMPLFFLGLYDLVHMKEVNCKPFFSIILGATGLFLSHNITALYVYVFGVIYLLFHPVKIYNIIKNKLSLIYSVVSVFLIIGLCSINLFQQLELMRTDFYNLTVGSRMYTDLDHVLNRVSGAAVYSGFLNVPWLDYYFPHETSRDLLIYGICIYILLTGAYVILDVILSNNRFKNKYINSILKFHILISSVIYILLMVLLVSRLEIILGALVVVLIYSVYSVSKSNNNESVSNNHNKEIVYLIISLIVTLVLIFRKSLWYILPSMFLNIQFPWRLWGLIAIFMAMLVPVLLSYFKDKRISVGVGVLLAGLLMVVNQILPETRLKLKAKEETGSISTTDWVYSIDDAFFTQGMSIGANGEYLPQIYYYYIPSYDSEYENSLYDKVNEQLFKNIGKTPYSIDPVVLSGEASINTTYKKAPVYKMDINVENEALIQIPLIYYDGYEITIKNKDTNKVYTAAGIEIDGLVSFKIQEGNYEVSTNYVGTPLRKFTRVLSGLCIIGLAGFIVFDLRISDEKKKRALTLFTKE